MATKPTPAQIEIGLRDRESMVRIAWALRKDYTPTPEQVARGMADEDEDVREAWAKRVRAGNTNTKSRN